jgi:hypothetical protein
VLFCRERKTLYHVSHCDLFLYGRYVYVYASGVWSGGWSRRYASTQVANVSCSWSSPVPCRSSRIGNGSGIGGRVLSMAEDRTPSSSPLPESSASSHPAPAVLLVLSRSGRQGQAGCCPWGRLLWHLRCMSAGRHWQAEGRFRLDAAAVAEISASSIPSSVAHAGTVTPTKAEHEASIAFSTRTTCIQKECPYTLPSYRCWP